MSMLIGTIFFAVSLILILAVIGILIHLVFGEAIDRAFFDESWKFEYTFEDAFNSRLISWLPYIPKYFFSAVGGLLMTILFIVLYTFSFHWVIDMLYFDDM